MIIAKDRILVRATLEPRVDYAQLALVSVAIGLVAFLYSSVGQAGASGYIATMTLCGFAAALIKPNRSRSQHSGGIHWNVSVLAGRAFLVESVLALCAAFPSRPPISAAISICLLPSSIRWWVSCFWFPLFGYSFIGATRQRFRPRPCLPRWEWARASGCLRVSRALAAGFFLRRSWYFVGGHTRDRPRRFQLLFILVNSIAALLGYFSSGRPIPSFAWLLAAPAVAGGTLGSYLGSQRFSVRTVCLLLAALLIIAGTKLIFTK